MIVFVPVSFVLFLFHTLHYLILNDPFHYLILNDPFHIVLK